MSQNPITPESEEPGTAVEATDAVEPVTEPATPPPAADPAVEESTIGTGTSMALGCIAGTVVLIIFGLLFLFFSTLV